LEEILLTIAFELGGRAGVRLTAELGLLAGRDALLSCIKNTSFADASWRENHVTSWGFGLPLKH